MQHTEQEIIEHCAKLLWGFNWAQSNSEDESVEMVSDDEDTTHYIPKGLTGEDKFLCAIFMQSHYATFLTPEILNSLYGWAKSASMNVKRNISFVGKRACVGDAYGYHGKGWIISSEFEDKIILLQEQNKSCLGCALLVNDSFGKNYECSINHEYLKYPACTHCDKIKLEVTEEFNNFWK